MANMLKIGDIVIWRGSWGKDAPKKAKVLCIEVNDIEVEEISWADINTREVVVTMDNNHWAYGNQISKW